MLHLLNFSILASFCIALIGIFVSEVYRKNTRLDLFVSIRNYYITFTVLILVNFLYSYQEAAFRDSPPGPGYIRFMLLVIFACIPVYTWFLSLFLHQLVHRRPSRIFRRLFFSVAFVLYGIYLADFLFGFIDLPVSFNLLFEIVGNVLSLLALGYVSLHSLAFIKKYRKKYYFRSILIINATLLLCYFMILMTILLFHLQAIRRIHLLLGFALCWAAANLVPLLHFKPLSGFLKRFDTNKDVEAIYTLLNKEFAVTPREYEIISLLSAGKSNREISDILYIGLQTVKDHNSRIFKKMQVDNRVQLVRKIHDLIR